MSGTITCHVWRLEKDEPQKNEYKQYTGIHVPGRQFQIAGCAFFGYSRIGSKWQWMVKEGGDSAGHIASQLNSKRAGGYVDVWKADVDIPSDWLFGSGSAKDTARQHTALIQDLIETAYRNGESRVSAQTDVADGSVTSELTSLVARARGVVSKLAANPDEALAEYSGLVGAAEAAHSDMELLDGYMEALQAMLSATKEAMPA